MSLRRYHRRWPSCSRRCCAQGACGAARLPTSTHRCSAHCATSAPPLRRRCTASAPSLRRLCATSAPSLRGRCTASAPPLRRHCTAVVPPLRPTPPLHSLCTASAPSLQVLRHLRSHRPLGKAATMQASCFYVAARQAEAHERERQFREVDAQCYPPPFDA